MADNQPLSREEHLFIVRVWREASLITGGQWRGSVEHVSTGERTYFKHLAEAVDFIDRYQHQTRQDRSDLSDQNPKRSKK